MVEGSPGFLTFAGILTLSLTWKYEFVKSMIPITETTIEIIKYFDLLYSIGLSVFVRIKGKTRPATKNNTSGTAVPIPFKILANEIT